MRKWVTILLAIVLLTSVLPAAQAAEWIFIPETDLLAVAPEGWVAVSREMASKEEWDSVFSADVVAALAAKETSANLDVLVFEDDYHEDFAQASAALREEYWEYIQGSLEASGGKILSSTWEEHNGLMWLVVANSYESDDEWIDLCAVTACGGKLIRILDSSWTDFTLQERETHMTLVLDGIRRIDTSATLEYSQELLPARDDVAVLSHVVMDLEKNWGMVAEGDGYAGFAHVSLNSSGFIVEEMDIYSYFTLETDQISSRTEFDTLYSSRDIAELIKEPEDILEGETVINGRMFAQTCFTDDEGVPGTILWHVTNGWLFRFIITCRPGDPAYGEILKMIETAEFWSEDVAPMPIEMPEEDLPAEPAEPASDQPETKLPEPEVAEPKEPAPDAVGGWIWLLGLAAAIAVAVIVAVMGKRRKKPMCPFCGATLPAGSRFCTACGHPLDQK